MTTSFIIHYLDWQGQQEILHRFEGPVCDLIEKARTRTLDLLPKDIPWLGGFVLTNLLAADFRTTPD